MLSALLRVDRQAVLDSLMSGRPDDLRASFAAAAAETGYLSREAAESVCPRLFDYIWFGYARAGEREALLDALGQAERRARGGAGGGLSAVVEAFARRHPAVAVDEAEVRRIADDAMSRR